MQRLPLRRPLVEQRIIYWWICIPWKIGSCALSIVREDCGYGGLIPHYGFMRAFGVFSHFIRHLLAWFSMKMARGRESLIPN